MEQKLLSDEILFAKGNDTVIIPTKREEDACYDIYANFKEDYMVINPHETVMIPTELYCAFSKRWKLELLERGSTGTKGMGQRAGQIDSGYRDQIFVPITNHNTIPVVIVKKDANRFNVVLQELLSKSIVYPYEKAITQAALVEVPVVEVKEVTLAELQTIPSERGTGALGSSQK